MEAQYQEAASTPTMGPSNDLSHIVKGKRTKRQRPQSPIPITIATISSNDGDSFNTTPEEDQIFLDSTTTKEEKDTARCLILLSQGHSHNHIYTKNFDTTYKIPNEKHCLDTHKKANGKSQIYNVYECRTCNRTFTSFQALGGHRASHTKPKAVMPNEEQQQQSLKKSCSTSSLYLQLSNNRATFNNNHHHKSSPRVHECAICGAEFASGQALGGHMRCHRGTLPIGSSATNTTLSFLSPLSNIMAMEENIDIHHESKKLKSGHLSLDLNLPAASEGHDENHRVGSKFSFPSKQQQQQQQLPLVLPTAPTLVN